MRGTFLRRIDELGRVVLPIEFRRALDIETHDALDVTLSDGTITIRRRERLCAFCGSQRRLTSFRGRHVCAACVDELSKTNEQMTLQP